MIEMKKTTMKNFPVRGALVAGALSVMGFAMPMSASATAFDGGIPAAWNCIGTCGTLGANGDVTTSPEGGDYGWVSTNNAPTSTINLIGGTNGSVLRSGVFGAAAGDDLEFYFNYVTSDGAQYTEYAWSRLLDSALNEVAILFHARTTTTAGGTAVPGAGLPPIVATINPATVTINDNATTWSPLGSSSGTCYSGGCGSTGWVQSLYTIPTAGNYVLEFGVVNWIDTAYDSGMAFDGITVGGTPIDDIINGVPAPGTLALLGLGLAALARRRAVTIAR